MTDYYSPIVINGPLANTADRYFPAINIGLQGGAASESGGQSDLFGSYDLDKLFIKATTNGDSGTVPVTLRVNGADSALTFNITASTPGFYEDATNTVSVTSGDLLSVFLNRTNANTMTVLALGLYAKSTQPFFTGACVRLTTGTASITRYVNVPGDGTLVTTENDRVRTVLPVDCSITNLYAYVDTNARSTSTTITLRKNAADTSAVLTIPASTTGHISDTSTVVTYASGDDYSVKFVTGTGSGLIGVVCGLQVINDDAGSCTQIIGGQAAFASTTTVHRGTALGGRIGVTSGLTAADSNLPFRGTCTLRKFRLNTTTNTSTISTAVDFEVNGALAGLSLVIPPSTTGTISDLSTEISITAGDLVNIYGLSSTGTGIKVVSWLTYEMDFEVTPPPSFASAQGVLWWN